MASGDWYVPAGFARAQARFNRINIVTGEGGWRLSFNTLATDNPQSTRFLQRFKVPLRLRIQKAITILDKPDVPSTPFIEAMEKMVNDPELLKLRDDRNEAAHEGRDDDEQVKDIMRRYFPAEMSEMEQTVGRMLDFAKGAWRLESGYVADLCEANSLDTRDSDQACGGEAAECGDVHHEEGPVERYAPTSTLSKGWCVRDQCCCDVMGSH